MSYSVSAALQAAVYQALAGDGPLNSLVGTAIYDAIPTGTLPATYVTLGPESVRDKSDQTGYGAEHKFTISVVTETSGFSTAKAAAAAVSDVLHDADFGLSRGRLVALRFDRATARRTGTAGTRQIDLRFSARVEDA
ncbi:MAG: DUF3168 domain-containing protein [Paracoccaceae bacterium]